VALDVDHVIVLDQQRHLGLQVALEGEVDIARREDQHAVHGRPRRKAQAEPAGPVRDRAGFGGVTPHAAHAGAAERHDQLGACARRDLHPLRGLEQPHAGAHRRFQCRVRHEPFERFRMLVGNHQHPGAALEDGGEFRRMKKALDRAIGNEAAAGKGRDGGGQRLQRVRRAGGADGNRHGLDRRDHLHVERPRAEPQQRQFCQLHVDGPRLRFREDRADLSRRHLAKLEHPDES
jgi:hypothetical protein